jgi:uncharacterized protein YdiU (UPF0061 family)
MQSPGTTLFRFDNSYARDLEGMYVPWKPAEVPAPRLLFLNAVLAEELGLDPADLEGKSGAALFAGNAVPEGAEPIAQAYAGHQFGGFSPQLGDGRALLLGEVVDGHGRRRDIAFKGSGRTPFSRGGDGKAAVGPMLREVLIGEAMHALGIPTTRALAVAATGEPVRPLDDAGDPRRRRWLTRVVLGAAGSWLMFVAVHRSLSGRVWWWNLPDLAPPLAFLVLPVGFGADQRPQHGQERDGADRDGRRR